jgi:hypothetical protein
MSCRALPLRQTRCTKTRGEISTPHPDPDDPPRRRAHKLRGHGTYANHSPPIIVMISRDTAEQRLWICNHAVKRTCHDLLAENIPAGGITLYTDEWQGYHGSHAAHATWATAPTNGCGMMMGMADARSTALPAPERPSGPTCAPSGASINSPCTSTWQRMKP